MARRLSEPWRDRYIRRSGADYVEPYLKLLPQGIAWPRETDSVLYRVVRGLAKIWGHVDGRAGDLLERESDPRKTIEILDWWERAWGLPDPCFPPGSQIIETFGENILDDTWESLNNAALETSGEWVTLTEDATDGTHYAKQTFAALAVGQYRASINWRAIGPAPRGMIFSVESLDSGANIWVNSDGTVNADETITWGQGGIIISGAKNVATADYWSAEFTLDVQKAGTFVFAGIYLVADDGLDSVDTYPGVLGGTGIAFQHPQLRTLKQTTVPVPQSIAERQKMLVLYMTWLGGQSRAYYQFLMKFIGYEVSYIGEFAPFMAGISEVGETRPTYIDENGNRVVDTKKNFRWYIGPAEMRFSWYVHAGSATLTWFRAASGQAGVDPHLRIGIPEDVQCLLLRWKPAHTFLAMDFSELAFGDPLAGTP
jgi:uncharacterized protein YmfQ (DUF2313 family)